jgi:hypothetical protein
MADNIKNCNDNVNNILQNLEQRGYKEVANILAQNVNTEVREQLLSTSMSQMSKEFTEKVGRPMTYSEMRSIWG